MIAYTAWDGLRAIAREHNADLTLDVRGVLVMAPRWEHHSAVMAARRFTTYLRGRLSPYQTAPTPRA